MVLLDTMELRSTSKLAGWVFMSPLLFAANVRLVSASVPVPLLLRDAAADSGGDDIVLDDRAADDQRATVTEYPATADATDTVVAAAPAIAVNAQAVER